MSWPVRNFSEVISSSGIFTDGDWVESKDQDPRGDVRLIQLADIGVGKFIDKSDRFMSSAKAKELRCTFLEAGDILVARMPDPIGRACIFPENMGKCVTIVDVCVVRPDSDDIDTKWLMHQINSENFKKQINQHVTGTTRQRISRGNLAKLEISVPPLAEQKRIATILDKADAIRRKRQQAIQLANEFLRATFLDMFGDPVTNPRGWGVKSLKELSLKISSGSTPKGGSKVYVDKGITFFRSQNVWKNDIRLDDVVFIDNKTHQSLIKSSLKHKDILMTKTGRFNTENSSLGRAALFLGEDDSANVNGHVYLIRLKENILHEFIVFILTSNEYRDHIRNVCVGGIDKRQLNKDHLEQFPIIEPPIELQKKFVQLIHHIGLQKKSAKQSLKESVSLFNSLSQNAFSGDLG